MIDRIVQGARDGAVPTLAWRRATGALASGAAALTLLVTSPRPVMASPFYDACLGAVDAWAQQCYDEHNMFGDLVCTWLGGLGIICCALGEAVVQLASSVGLPAY